MTIENDKELADNVRQAVATLNHALQRACEARIAVEFDAQEVATINSTPRMAIMSVQCSKVL